MKDSEPKPLAFIDYLPKPVRTLCGVAGFAMIAACGGGTPQEGKSSSGNASVAGGDLLNLPFPDDRAMNIQQGFLDDDGATHGGIDYIKGNIDGSPNWFTFPVLAAADGQACLNPPKREGNAVFIQHMINGATFFSYYGHLQDNLSKDIPECSSGKPKSVKKGEKIGDADSTGTPYLHLHFQVNDFQGNPVDPYGLNAKRDRYPKPDFSDGKECGPNALFAKCYENSGGTIIGASGPTQRTQTDSIRSATIVPTIKLTPTEVSNPTISATKTAISAWLGLIDYDLSGPYEVRSTPGNPYITARTGTREYHIKPQTPMSVAELYSEGKFTEKITRFSWNMHFTNIIGNRANTPDDAVGDAQVKIVRVDVSETPAENPAVRQNRLDSKITWQGTGIVRIIYKCNSNYNNGRIVVSTPDWLNSSTEFLITEQNRVWKASGGIITGSGFPGATKPIDSQLFPASCN